MKVVARHQLTPGMILGEDVINQNSLIYPAGTTLDQFMIERLKRYSVMCVTIMEKIDLAVTKYEKLQYDNDFIEFCNEYKYVLETYKEIMYSFVNEGIKPADEAVLALYDRLCKYIPSAFSLLDYFYSMMPNEDEVTFTHSLNSALLAGAISDWFQMNEEAKKTLILCGFYYDIGKLLLPEQLLWKSGQLTKEEILMMKKHPEMGYQLVLNMNLRQSVKNAILMHHERMDGTGYPFGLKDQQLDLYARYMAIIDAYMAMASPRSYRPAMKPLSILSIFQKDITKYDVNILLPVMDKIATAQIGGIVKLNDDSVWEVFMINKNKYTRPLLKNSKNEFLDLVNHPELSII